MNDGLRKIAVVGGVYREICRAPCWDELFGSAGRAACALAEVGARVSLYAGVDDECRSLILNKSAIYNFEFVGHRIERQEVFLYDTPISLPIAVLGGQSLVRQEDVSADCVLLFGVVDGLCSVNVSAERVVYDPQNPISPKKLEELNISCANIAIVLNEHELLKVSRKNSIDGAVEVLFLDERVSVVVVKCGPIGCYVFDRDGKCFVPAHKTSRVWKIGTGDIFSAQFAYYWGCLDRNPVQSAKFASLCTAYYSDTMGFVREDQVDQVKYEVANIDHDKLLVGKVYVASPFFSTEQLWLVNQVRNAIMGMGVKVFSPYHDVGLGLSNEIVRKDIEGIKSSDVIFANLNGRDVGTIFEVGFARASGKTVIVFSENNTENDMLMLRGSGCLVVDDLTTSVYKCIWEMGS